jgi:hypothetical protein
VDGALAAVDLHEPPEALHFGVDIADPPPGAPTDPLPPITPDRLFKLLRDPATGAGRGTGATEPAIKTLPLRPGGAIDIDAMANAAIAALGNPARFTSAEFALVMVEGVDLVTFQSAQPTAGQA